MHQKILILDFGSQYTQLIARRVSELNVYLEIHPFNNFSEPDETTLGIILSGSSASVHEDGSPRIDMSKLIHKLVIMRNNNE